MPYVTQAAQTNGGTASVDRPLITTPYGLASNNQTGSEAAAPTTGIAGGMMTTGSILTAEINGIKYRLDTANGATTPPTLGMVGGLLVVQGLAAATYEFGVMYKASSGLVLAKNRRLHVWVVPKTI